MRPYMYTVSCKMNIFYLIKTYVRMSISPFICHPLSTTGNEETFLKDF